MPRKNIVLLNLEKEPKSTCSLVVVFADHKESELQCYVLSNSDFDIEIVKTKIFENNQQIKFHSYNLQNDPQNPDIWKNEIKVISDHKRILDISLFDSFDFTFKKFEESESTINSGFLKDECIQNLHKRHLQIIKN